MSAKMITVNSENVPDFIKNCYTLKPKDLFMDELTWKFLIRNILRGKNILLVGPQGAGKTLAAHCGQSVLNRPMFNIPLGSTQDPRSALIGNTNYSKEKGTFFTPSYFVEAISTPNAVVLLEELSRAHPDAWNLLMPVLDESQRFLRLEEKEGGETVNVAPGVSFVATANIGNQFTSTRVLDRALIDRFVIVEVKTLDKDSEFELLKMKYPSVKDELLIALSSVSAGSRDEAGTESSKLTEAISTRLSIETAGLMADGFGLLEAAEVAIYPFFSKDGGNDSERTYIKQMLQRFIDPSSIPEPTPDPDDDKFFTQADIDSATP